MNYSVLELSSITTEYVKIPVSAKVDGEEVNPTVYPLSFAAAGIGEEPEDVDFSEGAWDTDAARGVYYGTWLVDQLADGRYDLWVRIQAPPEDVKRKVAVLVIT